MQSSANICSFFFEPVYDPDAPPPVPSPPPSPSAPKKRGRKKRVSLGGANRHRCQVCHNVYTQATSTGYTNLLTHLRVKHPNWEEMFKAQQVDGTVAVAVATSETSEEIAVSPFQIQSISATSSASKRGRKRGPVYDHFEDIPSSPGSKQKKMRCVYCHEDTSQLSGRMKFHLSARCPQVPEDVKKKYAAGVTLMSTRIDGIVAKSETVKVDTVITPEKPTTMLTSPVTSLNSPITMFKPPSIKVQQSPVLKTSPQAPVPKQIKREADNLRLFEEKLTTALVTTNTPWSLLDNADFSEAMKILHPASTNFPLTSTRARGEVLDRLTQKYDRDCREILSVSNAITLVVNTTGVEENGAKKMTYVALDEWRRAFVLANATDASTSPYVAEVLSIVSDLPNRPRTKLFLCTPTSGAYARMRLESRPNAGTSGKLFTLMGACMTQQTALLLHELVLCSMSMEEALDNAILIADALHVIPSLRQRVLRSIYPGYDDEDSIAFVQVSVTSWRSIAMAVKQATRLEPFLSQAISEERPSASPLLHQLIEMRSSEIASNSLRHTTQLLTPLHFISVLSELQTTTSGQLLALWIWLFGTATRSPLLDGNSDALITTFMQRLECYVEEHFIACLVLDPRVHGAGLSVSGLRRARAVTFRVAAALIPNFSENNFFRSYNDYMKQQGDFSESSVWNAVNTSNPMEFWGDYEGDQLHNQLAVVAKAVCSFVPHTCSLEELWTAHAQRTKAVQTNVSKQQEKCTKIRYGAALSARTNSKDIVSKFLPLLDVDNEASVEEMLQSNAAYQEKVEQANTRNLSVRSVLESVEDGMEEDAAGSNASSTSLDASWFDISSTGLDKIRNAMQNYLSAITQQ